MNDNQEASARVRSQASEHALSTYFRLTQQAYLGALNNDAGSSGAFTARHVRGIDYEQPFCRRNANAQKNAYGNNVSRKMARALYGNTRSNVGMMIRSQGDDAQERSRFAHASMRLKCMSNNNNNNGGCSSSSVLVYALEDDSGAVGEECTECGHTLATPYYCPCAGCVSPAVCVSARALGGRSEGALALPAWLSAAESVFVCHRTYTSYLRGGEGEERDERGCAFACMIPTLLVSGGGAEAEGARAHNCRIIRLPEDDMSAALARAPWQRRSVSGARCPVCLTSGLSFIQPPERANPLTWGNVLRCDKCSFTFTLA